MSDHPSAQASHPAELAQAAGQFYRTAPGQPGQAPADKSGTAGRVLRLLALVAVVIGVLVLAAAAFVLSYPGIHGLALQAGVSTSLARGYPVIFDAMLVIAGAAVLSLRGGGLVSRVYAWLSLLVLLGAAAGADALHSTRAHLPHRTAEAAAAIIPWALVLIGFGLLLAMLRHARLHRAAPAARTPRGRRGQAAQPAPGGQPGPGWQAGQPAPPAPGAPAGQYRPAGPPFAALPPGTSPQAPAPAMNQLSAPAQPPAPALPAAPAAGTAEAAARPAQPPAVPAQAQPHASEVATGEPSTVQAGTREGHASQTDAGQAGAGQADTTQASTDQASTTEAASAAAEQPDQGPELAIDADPEQDDPSTDEGIYAAAPPSDDADDSAGHDVHPPAFHRMWSSPTPPGEDYEA